MSEDYTYDPWKFWATLTRAEDGTDRYACAKCDLEFSDWSAFCEHARACQVPEAVEVSS
jgi:hypothetical protein